MNILFISGNSPEISIGGLERYVSNLLKFCTSKTNHKFMFLLPKSQKQEEETRGNLTIYRKNFMLFKPKRIFGKKVVTPKQVENSSRALIQFVNDLEKKEHIDCCVVQSGETWRPQFCLSLHLACMNNNIPLVLQVHSFPSREISRILINSLFWKKILTVSGSLAGDLYAKGADIKKLGTKYLGVDKKVFNARLSKSWLKKSLGLKPDNKVIFHASRITNGRKSILKEKGIITLLEAFSKIYEQHPELYVIIGAATPPKFLRPEFEIALQEIKDYANLYGVADRVVVKSFPLDKVAKAYAGSDLFVMASENETFGQVYLESMACGTPVIGTNVGGVPEIIKDGYNGFLIPANDASVMCNKVEELLWNQEVRRKFIKNGLKVSNHRFSAKKRFSAMLAFLADEVV